MADISAGTAFATPSSATTMNSFPHLGLLATLLISGTVAAEERAGTLAQAREAFAALDANKDGRLCREELAVPGLQLSPAEICAVDFDQDGFWSKDEFLLFHRQRLLAAKVKPAADLEAEAARIQAARKAKATERSTRRDVSGARPSPADKGAKNNPKPAPPPAPAPRPKPAGQDPKEPPPRPAPPHGSNG